MAAAASTTTASRANPKKAAHQQQPPAGDVAPLAAAAALVKHKQSHVKQRTNKQSPDGGVAQPGEQALIPRRGAGSNPAAAAAKKSAGRKTKYTPETVQKIVEALRVGATHDLALHYAGVGKSAFYQWMQDKPGFEAMVRQAEGEAAVSWLTVIEQAAAKNWQAAAWKLERRYPEMYGRTVQTQEQHGEVQHTLRIVYVDDWRAKQAQLDEPTVVDAEQAS